MTEKNLYGLLTSTAIGLALACFIVFFSNLGSRNDNTKNTTSESTGMNDISPETPKPTCVPEGSNSKSVVIEAAVGKSRKLQKVLGMSEADLRRAVGELISERCPVVELIIKKTRKLQRVLGMNEGDIREATRKSQLSESSYSSDWQLRRDRNTSSDLEEPWNWFKILDGFVIFILLAIFCYFFNLSTNGDFGRILVGLFPKEFEALGLKEYFERLSPGDPRHSGEAGVI